MSQNPPDQERQDISKIFEMHGWSEVALKTDGKFWGFSEGAVMQTPVPQATVNAVLGAGYKSPFEPSLRGLRSALNTAVVVLILSVSALSFIPFFFPHNTLYRIGSITNGKKASTEYETFRRPYTIGSTTYLYCNGGIAKISGDSTYFVINPERTERNEQIFFCK